MSVYSAQILADGAFGYYRLNDSSGSICVDSASNGNGTYVNSPTLSVTGAIAGDSDKAVTFASASSHRVDLPFIGAFQTGDGSYECWYKGTTTGVVQVCVGEGSTITGSRIIRTTIGTGNTAVFNARNSVGTNFSVTGTTTLTDGNYHYIVGVISGTTLTLYVDGVSEGTPATFTGSKPTDENRTTIGANFNTAAANFMNGTLDEVAIYKLALTATQIKNHYNLGMGHFQTYSVDGLLLKTQTATYNIDALLKKTQTITNQIDADLKKTQIIIYNIDADLKQTTILINNIDADLKKTQIITHQIDGVLKNTFIINHLVDADLKQNSVISNQVDADLKNTFILSYNLDSLLLKTNIITYNIDTILKQTQIISNNLDALLLARMTITHLIDAELLEAFVKIYSLDSVLLKHQIKIHSIDSLLVAGTITVTINSNIDGYLIRLSGMEGSHVALASTQRLTKREIYEQVSRGVNTKTKQYIYEHGRT